MTDFGIYDKQTRRDRFTRFAVLADIEFTSRINDTYGHQVCGGRVLECAAALIEKASR